MKEAELIAMFGVALDIRPTNPGYGLKKTVWTDLCRQLEMRMGYPEGF